ncbi:MAG: DNA mismatch repair protein MutS [Cyanobacteria bacterium REEB446]|nr:DNA mismatch repair protein MutS [Cyanobacteria bacterium REEB446]
MTFLSFYPAVEEFSLYTPVMQQYLNARLGLQKDALLLFRMGDFYEAFFDDARIISRELDITLTARPETNHPEGKIPMAGVPAKAVKPYIAKLLERGYKVSIAEQMADPKTCKGLVPREVCATYTAGTLSELDLLKSNENNYIASIFAKPNSEEFGLAYVDLSTGEFCITELQQYQVESELFRIKPSELLVPSLRGEKSNLDIERPLEAMFSFKYPYSHYDVKNFDTDLAFSHIKREFRLQQLSRDLQENYSNALRAAGALIEYFAETQKALFLKNSGKLFDSLKTYQSGEYVSLDVSTRRNLEVTRSLYSGKVEGSLLSAIDRTNCSLGKRRLNIWLEQPLCDLKTIQLRQEAVQSLYDNPNLEADLYEILAGMPDLSRLSQRLALETINPRELIALKDSLLVFERLSQVLSKNYQGGYSEKNAANNLNELFKSPYFEIFKTVPTEIKDFISEIEFQLLDNPSVFINEAGIFRKGVNPELDELISLMEDGTKWLNAYEESLKESTGIKTLKVTFNKVHGYYIEISKTNQKLIPAELTIKQTLVNAVRCMSEELKAYENKVFNAEFARSSLENRLYTELRSKSAINVPLFKAIANAIADLSVLTSFSLIARERNYVRPYVDDSDALFIEAGRHPVLEQKLGLGKFVDNDICLSSSSEMGFRFILLTGPNMAGKSTYMRQNALIILLAQIGSFVPAAKARIGLVDRIFTRIGASDDLASGQSTFMVEMNEVANIVNGMSPKSFLVLDEVGRGTSTYDGISIAWAIVEFIVEQICPRTIFATHYHELAQLEKNYSGRIINAQMSVSEPSCENPQIAFLHKVKAGSATKSYGIEVARLAGLPQDILDRAMLVNQQLERSLSLPVSNKALKKIAAKSSLGNESTDFNLRPLFNWKAKEKADRLS